ncbi:hypothetical protein Tco_1251385, partial [Tanacetum coccineum]
EYNSRGSSASTPTDLEKPLVKDADANDVDEHLYRSMIGSLMYLTTSRPYIMFAVCACARFQVSPKTSNLLAVKRIFRYLKGKPSLSLWYSKDSPLELVAYTDSDYAGATLDRKSTTRGCQFLGNRLISWQCKKQTVVATSTTEAEYVAAANCYRRVLWIQNQLLDYGYNFMNNVIYIDNTSTICIIENPVQHSKTKHLEIRHHFIRDCNAKKLIQMAKIDTQHNVADLLTSLEFCDKHNMVAFLEKSTGSAGFHQIIDFINRSHICYALTKKPEVCVSFIKQFWRSAEILTDENGNVKIHATIDGHSLSITEGSLRRHLKLDDQDGITSLPTTEIFAQLALMGYATDSDKLTFQKDAAEPSPSPSRITSSPSPTPTPSPLPQPSPTQPSPTQPSPTQPSRTQLSPTQADTEYHPPTPHDSPLHAVHSHGSEEGSLKLQELMNLVNTLFDRIGVLEADLLKTKKAYSSAYTKLILRVKKLESQIKKVTPTEIIQDQEASGKASDEISTAGLKKDTASEDVPTVSTAEATLSTAGGTVTYSRRSAEKRSRKNKGKAILIEEEPKKKYKKDLEQEQLSYAEAIRIEEQMNEEQKAQIARDEEIARQWDEEERKRAMDEAKSTKKIDWNDPAVIRYHSLKMKPKTIAQARRNMIKYLKNQGNYKVTDFKGMSYNDIRPIFEKL